ncbi:hypothetical protein GCM10027398_00860 [Azotobacter salinestris]
MATPPFGVAAGTSVTGELRRVAEVFRVVPAVPALAAGVPQPGDADPLAERETLDARPNGVHPADDLVAGDDTHRRQFAVDHVQVGTAHPAGGARTRSSPGPSCGSGSSRSIRG